MGKRKSSISAWAAPRPFRFESTAPLAEVAQHLTQFAQDNEGYKLSLEATESGYHFQYQLQRSGNHRWYTTASAEGRIWEEKHGHVIVEGVAQTATMSQYGKTGFVIAFLTLAVFLFTDDLLTLFPLIPLATGALLIVNYYKERDIMVESIAQIVNQPIRAAAQAPDKKYAQDDRTSQKQTAPQSKKHAPKGKHSHSRATRLAQPETVHSDSIWHEAISEYDSRTQQDL